MERTDQLLTRHEAARRAGVTYNTILLWERAGRLHPVPVRRGGRRERFFIRSSELQRVAAPEQQATIDPGLVWHEEELGPAPPPADPDPEAKPDDGDGLLGRLFHRG